MYWRSLKHLTTAKMVEKWSFDCENWSKLVCLSCSTTCGEDFMFICKLKSIKLECRRVHNMMICPTLSVIVQYWCNGRKWGEKPFLPEKHPNFPAAAWIRQTCQTQTSLSVRCLFFYYYYSSHNFGAVQRAVQKVLVFPPTTMYKLFTPLMLVEQKGTIRRSHSPWQVRRCQKLLLGLKIDPSHSLLNPFFSPLSVQWKRSLPMHSRTCPTPPKCLSSSRRCGIFTLCLSSPHFNVRTLRQQNKGTPESLFSTMKQWLICSLIPPASPYARWLRPER